MMMNLHPVDPCPGFNYFHLSLLPRGTNTQQLTKEWGQRRRGEAIQQSNGNREGSNKNNLIIVEVMSR
jgi:hypothetical protein